MKCVNITLIPYIICRKRRLMIIYYKDTIIYIYIYWNEKLNKTDVSTNCPIIMFLDKFCDVAGISFQITLHLFITIHRW